MIREYLEKRRVRKTFEKLVDPETVEALLRDGGVEPSIKQGRIEFVLAFVRGEGPSQISERMARVADIAVEHDATVYDLVGGLVIVAFGTHPASSPQAGSRALLVQALREQLASDVKIVHGSSDGHHGLFGSETRISYTFLVPQFDSILGALSRLQFGESEEFTR
jgi:hypothetical protein